MILLVLLLAQSAPDTNDLLKYLGPFVVFAVPTTFWIRDLLARLRASQAREALLTDRLVEIAERSTPALADAVRLNSEISQVLPKVLDELRYRRREP